MILSIITTIVLLVFFIIKRSEVIGIFARRAYASGNIKRCLKRFALANRIGKLGPASLMFYGYILLRDGQLELGKTILTHASISAKKVELKKRIKSLLAVCEWKEGDIDTAIEMTEEAMRDCKTTNLYQNLGLFYIIKGEPRKALEFNKEAYDYNSDDAMIMDNLATAYVLYGDDANAEKIYEKLIDENPRFPEAYYGYGQLLIRKGEKEKGIEYIEKSLEKTFSFLSVLQREDVEKMLEEAKCNSDFAE